MKQVTVEITPTGLILFYDAKTKERLFDCERLKLAQEWLRQEQALVIETHWL